MRQTLPIVNGPHRSELPITRARSAHCNQTLPKTPADLALHARLPLRDDGLAGTAYGDPYPADAIAENGHGRFIPLPKRQGFPRKWLNCGTHRQLKRSGGPFFRNCVPEGRGRGWTASDEDRWEEGLASLPGLRRGFIHCTFHRFRAFLGIIAQE